MAKYGEGDSRWIVSERNDGRNVGSWHWEERNATQWSRERLHELFENKQLVQTDSLSVVCTGVSSLTGDAYINQRKGKLIPGYEVELKLGYSAFVPNDQSNEPSTGTIHFPYIADENEDEDPEVKVLLPAGGGNDTAKAAKHAIQKDALKDLISTVKQWEREMHAGGPAGAHANSSAAQKADAKQQQQRDNNSAAVDASTSSSTASEKKKKEWESRSSRHNGYLCLMEEFLCRPNDLYRCVQSFIPLFIVPTACMLYVVSFTPLAKFALRCVCCCCFPYRTLTEADRIKSFSRAEASVDAKKGGSFSMFDGNVNGTFVELEQDEKIVQQWRFSNWPAEKYSDVKITFDEPEHGKTFLILEQSNIPASGIPILSYFTADAVHVLYWV